MKILKRTILILIAALCLALMAFSAYNLYLIYVEYAAGEQLYSDTANRFVSVIEGAEAPSFGDIEGDSAVSEREKAPISVAFDELLLENGDIVGWIFCEGTVVSYPIVQSDDNSYYLRRMLNGKYNTAGTLFLDYRCSADFTDFNSIVYGHNMRNGSMFAVLPRYKEQQFYTEHPVWYLLLPNMSCKIELIGGYTTPSDSAAYTIPEDEAGRDALCALALEGSTFTAEARALAEGERLITLSTCESNSRSKRYVLVGVLSEVYSVRKGE